MGRYSITEVNAFDCVAGRFLTKEEAVHAVAIQCLKDWQKAGVIFEDDGEVTDTINDNICITGIIFTSQAALDAVQNILSGDNTMTTEEYDHLLDEIETFFAGDGSCAIEFFQTIQIDPFTKNNYFYYDYDLEYWHDFVEEFDKNSQLLEYLNKVTSKRS